MSRGRYHVDITGKRFGRLVVLKYGGCSHGRSRWVCRCDCGTEKPIPAYRLTHGLTVSCGCFRREAVSKLRTTHGMSETKEYRAWFAMIKRCTYKKHIYYHRYGGRGIKVHAEWLHNFQAFFDHVGECPSRDHTLGRIRNDGHYEPGNVEWQTRKQQMRNTCMTRLVEFEGRQWVITDLAQHLKVSRASLVYRINHNIPLSKPWVRARGR